MKLIKRTIAICLSFLMLSHLPVGVLAQSSVSGNDAAVEAITLDFLPKDLIAESESMTDSTAVITTNSVTLYKSLDNGAEGIEVAVESGTVIDLITKYTFTVSETETLVFYRYDYYGSNEALNNAALSEYSGYVFIYSGDIFVQSTDNSGNSGSTDTPVETDKTDAETGVVVSAELPENVTLAVTGKTLAESGLDTTIYPVNGASLFYDVTLYQDGTEYQPENGVTVTFPEAVVTSSGLAAGDYYKVYHIHDGVTDVTGPYEYIGGSIAVDFANLSVVGISESEAPIDLLAQHGGTYTVETIDEIDLTISADSVTLYDSFESSVYTAEVKGASGIEVTAYQKVTFEDGFVLYHYEYVGDDSAFQTVANVYSFIVSTDVSETTEKKTLTEIFDSVAVTVAGNIPDGVKLTLRGVSADVENISQIIGAIDITLSLDGEIWQPAEGETVTVTISAAEIIDYNGKTVEIVHDHGGTFRSLGKFVVTEGMVTFTTDGFSDFYIVSGEMENGLLINENSTIYVMAGSKLIFSGNVTGTDTEYFKISSSDVTVAQNAPFNATTVIKYNNRYDVTIIVRSQKEIIAELLSKPLVLSILKNAGDGVPGEPANTSASFTNIGPANEDYPLASGFAVYWADDFAESAEGYIAPDIASMPGFATSIDGTATMGIYDATGVNTLNALTDKFDWNAILSKLAQKGEITASDGTELTTGNMSEYKVVPYVIKYMTSSGNSLAQEWHIDLAIVPKDTATLSYQVNFPTGFYVDGLKAPSAQSQDKGESVNVQYLTQRNSNITVGKTFDVTDISGNKYTITYLGWSTDASVSVGDENYAPGESFNIQADTTLYGVWKVEGVPATLTISKVISGVDPEDIPANLSFSFTIQVKGDEKSTSVTLNAENDWKSTIFVNAGTYTITETTPDAEISGFTYSKTEIRIGDTITTGTTVNDLTLNGGNSYAVVFTNVYEQKTGTLVIEKTVILAYENDTLPNDTFTFTVSGDALADGTYNVTIDGVSNTVQASNGKLTVSLSGFTAGQKKTITINGIPAGKYTVTESGDEDYLTTAPSGSITVTAGGTGTASFINEYKRHLVDLTIKKTGWNATDENQSFIFDVNGPSGFKITVTINGNGAVMIKDLPIGEYTVTERTDWSCRYNMASVTANSDKSAENSDRGIKFDLTADGETVNFDNTRSLIYWLSGDSYNENQFTIKTE